jgi:hypothetical protein
MVRATLPRLGDRFSPRRRCLLRADPTKSRKLPADLQERSPGAHPTIPVRRILRFDSFRYPDRGVPARKTRPAYLATAYRPLTSRSTRRRLRVARPPRVIGSDHGLGLQPGAFRDGFADALDEVSGAAEVVFGSPIRSPPYWAFLPRPAEAQRRASASIPASWSGQS